jgi:nitroreductase
MDVYEVLRTTRAMRRLKPDLIPDDVIARVVDAGVRAPSPGPVQQWRFVVVTDRAVMARLGSLWRATRDEVLVQTPNLYPNAAQASSSQYLYDHFDDVPALILGYGPPGIGSVTVIQALWSMCLAARAEGIGSAFTTLLTRAADQVADILAIPADVGLQLYGALPLGYPMGTWKVAPRQPAHEVTFADRWGEPPRWRAAAGSENGNP